MGQFHFAVPSESSQLLEQTLWKDAYICGIEGVPWECHNSVEHGVLSISRPIDSSGKLYLTCPTKGLGYRTLSTCSLMPLANPHPLYLELARGSCFRARVQSSSWERAGLTLGDLFAELLQRGTAQFLDAAQSRNNLEECSRSALQAIATLEQAIADLGESFALQSIAYRKQREPQLGTLLAGSVVPPSPTKSTLGSRFERAFNCAAVRMNWGTIEAEAGKFDFTGGMIKNTVMVALNRALAADAEAPSLDMALLEEAAGTWQKWMDTERGSVVFYFDTHPNNLMPFVAQVSLPT